MEDDLIQAGIVLVAPSDGDRIDCKFVEGGHWSIKPTTEFITLFNYVALLVPSGDEGQQITHYAPTTSHYSANPSPLEGRDYKFFSVGLGEICQLLSPLKFSRTKNFPGLQYTSIHDLLSATTSDEIRWFDEHNIEVLREEEDYLRYLCVLFLHLRQFTVLLQFAELVSVHEGQAADQGGHQEIVLLIKRCQNLAASLRLVADRGAQRILATRPINTLPMRSLSSLLRELLLEWGNRFGIFHRYLFDYLLQNQDQAALLTKLERGEYDDKFKKSERILTELRTGYSWFLEEYGQNLGAYLWGKLDPVEQDAGATKSTVEDGNLN